MKHFLKFSLLFLCACGSAPEEDDGYITSAGGEENDSLEILTDSVVYDMSDQPLIITYFYKLSPEQITTDFCYDEAQVKNLLLGDGPDEYVWVSKKVQENYLTFDNDECYTSTTFALLNPQSDTPHAILIQSSKGSQKTNIYFWNEGGGIWEEETNYPKLKLTDFYADLSDEDNRLVNEFGKYFAYFDKDNLEVVYTFSTWQMGLNADGKEIMDFNKEPDFSFGLQYSDEEGFWMTKKYENKDLIPDRFFLAYSETGEISDDFSYFSDLIGEQLEEDGVESGYADFSQTDYKAFFSADTFDFSAMQQFEPRNGFWIYERGKEPLDLEYDMVEPTVKKAKRYFSNHP